MHKKILELLLQNNQKPKTTEIVAFAQSADEEGARLYGEIIGAQKMRLELVEDPVEAAIREGNSKTSIIIGNAENPNLREVMFGNPGTISLFVDHNYIPNHPHQSPSLQTVGTTQHVLRAFHQTKLNNVSPVNSRATALKSVFGNATLTYQDVRQAFASSRVTNVPVHVLGPDGTNISQVARKYVHEFDLSSKADIIVHPSGVEPLQYAEFNLSHRTLTRHL